MRFSTLLMIILATVFGSAAVFFANNWISNQAPRQMAAIVQPVEEQATIVVAAKDFVFGDPLQAETLKEIPWAKSSVPEGAFSKISELTVDGRRVALASISTNEAILKWKISGAGGRASLSTTVTEGMRAVAIRVDDVVGVGGFVLPGDRVDLLYTRSANRNNEKESATNDVLVQNVRVLAIDQVVDQKNEKPVVARVVTVEVLAQDAQKVALAQNTGSVMLSLRAAGSTDNANAQRVVEEELVSNPSVYMAKLEQRDAAQVKLEQQLADVATEANKSKDALKAQLADIENKLKGEIANAGADAGKLKEQLASLQQAMANSNGKMSDELRKKIAELQASMRKMSSTPVVMVEPAAADEPERTITVVGVRRGIAKREIVEVVPENGFENVE